MELLEENSKSLRIKPNFKVFWAKVPSYAPWPARFCSEPEENELMKKTNMTSLKPTQHGTTFLGYRLEKAWINEHSMDEFVQDSWMEKFQAKKYKSDRNYRAAVIEAIRLSMAIGHEFSEDILELVKNPSSDVQWEREDVCTVCGGTELSGKSLLCDHCDTRETHFHCLRTPIIHAPKGKWFCDVCCEELGYPPGKILPPPPPSRKQKQSLSSSTTSTSPEVESVDPPPADDQQPPSTTATTKRKRQSNSNGKSAKQSTQSTNGVFENIQSQSSEKKPKLQLDVVINNGSSSGSKGQLHSSNAKSKLLNKQTGNDAFFEDSAFIASTYSNHNQNTEDCDLDGEKIEDETCFVCRESGNVIICDYPGCPRVYHQVCIFTTLPPTSLLPDHMPSISDMDGDRWFCPKHFCIQCSAIDTPDISYVPVRSTITSNTTLSQETQGGGGVVGISGENDEDENQEDKEVACNDMTPDIQSVPEEKSTLENDLTAPIATSSNNIVEVQTINNSNSSSNCNHRIMGILPKYLNGVANYLQCKRLRSCSTCSFAICSLCEQDITTSACIASGNSTIIQITNNRSSIFRSKRGILSGKSLECLNCTSQSPTIQLAKILEKAWVRLASSRLSLPFLRPLLPLPNDHTVDSNQSHYTENNTPAFGGDMHQHLSMSRNKLEPIDILKEVDPLFMPAVTAAAGDSPTSASIYYSTVPSYDDYQSGHVDNKLQSIQLIQPSQSVTDLISISEKIRNLSYRSINSFLDDIQSLRRVLVSKLITTLGLEYNEDRNKFTEISSNGSSNTSGFIKIAQIILSGFDTIYDSSQGYLSRNRGIVVDAITKKIKEQINYPMSNDTTNHTNGHIHTNGHTNKNGYINNGVNSNDSSNNSNNSLATNLSLIMNGLWRKECQHSIISNIISNLSSNSGNNNNSVKIAYQKKSLLHQYQIVARDIDLWSKHITEGSMPEGSRGIISPWCIWNPISNSSNGNGDNTHDQCKISLSTTLGVENGVTRHYRYNQSNLNNFFTLINEEVLEQEAVKGMLNLDGRYDRETITLMEDKDIDISPWNKFYETAVHKNSHSNNNNNNSSSNDNNNNNNSHSNNEAMIENGIVENGNVEHVSLSQGLVEDETSIILDRLKDLTTKTLHLQVKLQREYQKSQERMMSDEIGESVTVGEVQAIRRLKIINHDLKWQVEQKNRSIISHKAIIEDLAAQLAQSKETILQLTHERDDLSNRLCTEQRLSQSTE